MVFVTTAPAPAWTALFIISPLLVKGPADTMMGFFNGIPKKFTDKSIVPLP
jgi:hypothetical protein